MPKEVQQYQCEYCHKIFSSEKECIKHESTCESNPSIIEQKRLQNQFQSKVEEIRLTSRTIFEVIERTINLLKEYDIELQLNSFPNMWGDEISNSHNSPLGYPSNWCNEDKNKPSSYPGWKGRWSGTIKGVIRDRWDEKYRNIDFGDITKSGRFNDLSFAINYINTGSGSGGDKFSMEGILWLYDFPLIHQEWKNNKGDFNLLKKEYSQKLQDYKDTFTTSNDEYINQQPDIINMNELYQKSIALSNLIQSNRDKLKEFHSNEFTKNYKIPFPKMTSTFIDLVEYKSVASVFEDKQVTYPKDLIQCEEQLHTLLKEYNKYLEMYPERFY